jgi:hypothetical protein
MCTTCEEEEEGRIHRKEAGGAAPAVTPAVESRLDATRGGGQRLPESVRAQMEPRFGADFSGVRVHSGGEAAALSRDLKAQAFTQQQDIYFGTGKYNLESSSGQQLLVHELTHVVQQSGTPSSFIQRENGDGGDSEVAVSQVAQRYGWLQGVLTHEQWSALMDAEQAVIEGNLVANSYIRVPLEYLLDAQTFFVDEDIWDTVYSIFLANGDGVRAGLLIRNEIKRRWFSENSLFPELDEVTISVVAPDAPLNTNTSLTFELYGTDLGELSGLLSLPALDEKWNETRLENIIAEVSDQANQLGQAANLVNQIESVSTTIPRFISRVRTDFSRYSLRQIRGQLASVRRLKSSAERLSERDLTSSRVSGVGSQVDPLITDLESLLADAQAWYSKHQPELTNQELYDWAGTELVTYAGNEWEEGGLGYVTGGLGYTGAGVLAIFDGLGDVFTFGYQSTRGQIITAYRQGSISYQDMESLSEDALVRSVTTGVVTIALTVATAGFGGWVAGGLGLARGTLGYAVLSTGIEGALGNVVAMGTETLLTEVRSDYRDPYAQAIWAQGSHGFGDFALSAGMGFGLGAGFGGLLHLRTPTPGTALALVDQPPMPSTGLGALPEESMFGPALLQQGADTPIWHVVEAGIEPLTGGQRFYARHVSGEIVELVVDDTLNGYAVRHATGEIAYIEAGQPTRGPRGLLPSEAGFAGIGDELVPTSTPGSGSVIEVGPGGAIEVLPEGAVARPLSLPPGSRAPRQLTPPLYESWSDLAPFLDEQFGAEATSQITWQVTPEGTVFAAPPIENIPIYAPDYALPPGQIFAGRTPTPMLAGPLSEGFTPFDILPGRRPTTLSLAQVRRMRGGNKARGTAAEIHTAEQSGGTREVYHDLPSDRFLPRRRADVISPTSPGTLMEEVKNYLRYIGGSNPQVREVALDTPLRQEIWRDAMIMHYYPNYQPVWVFTDAPPSIALVTALQEAGIPYRLMSDRLPFR